MTNLRSLGLPVRMALGRHEKRRPCRHHKQAYDFIMQSFMQKPPFMEVGRHKMKKKLGQKSLKYERGGEEGWC